MIYDESCPHPFGYQVVVDGIPWEDADGNDTWDTESEAASVARHCERQGYTSVEVQLKGTA